VQGHVAVGRGRLVAAVAAAGAIAGVVGGAPAAATHTVKPLARLTPGKSNPAVTQATIGSTICVSGWTRTVRPSESYTNRLKLQQMTQYGETGPPSAYEEDHFIPLELGGAPRDPRNLWPEPHAQSRRSDPLETRLKHEVCDGAITLAQGRAQIRAFKRLHG
jgi:hypothetical protein